jgi:hypothetical protein
MNMMILIWNSHIIFHFVWYQILIKPHILYISLNVMSFKHSVFILLCTLLICLIEYFTWFNSAVTTNENKCTKTKCERHRPGMNYFIHVFSMADMPLLVCSLRVTNSDLLNQMVSIL